MSTADQRKREYAEAKARFPSLVAVNDPPSEFHISFQKNGAPYEIRLGPKYPLVCPEIFQGSTAVHVVLTENWVEVFSLVDVVQQLSLAARPPPKLFQIDYSELQSTYATYSRDLAAPGGPERVIAQLRCCQGLQQRRAESEQAEQAASSRHLELVDAAIPMLESIRDLLAKKRGLEAELNPQRTAALRQRSRERAFDTKIDELKREAAEYDCQIAEATRQLSQGVIQADVFARTLLELAEKANYAKLITEELERQR
jgi:hypothetical protein